MKNKQMYEIHLFYFSHFFFFFGGGGGIDDYFANFARDISLNAVVMSKMSNFTIFGVSSTPPPPPPPTTCLFTPVSLAFTEPVSFLNSSCAR